MASWVWLRPRWTPCRPASWPTCRSNRFGEPREIADAVIFLASDESRFTVGSELIIDGGMSTL
jgi:NAD(P)-dependent dehydrogenase (short-subunit alcohol dehydrogenase family)